MAKKWVMFLLTLALLAAGYRLVSEYTWQRSLGTSLATPLDALIPLLPGTVILYLTVYFFWLPPIISKKVSHREFLRVVVAVIAAFATSLAIHLIIPSAYPRPAISADDSFGRYILQKILYSGDLPNNTFPSTHVVVAATLVLMMANKFKPWAFRAYYSWGVLISLSTLTVKQHYFFDVLAGVAIALLITWAIKKIWPVANLNFQSEGQFS